MENKTLAYQIYHNGRKVLAKRKINDRISIDYTNLQFPSFLKAKEFIQTYISNNANISSIMEPNIKYNIGNDIFEIKTLSKA